MNDHFLELATTTEQPLADRTCAVLEEAGIPVILEHVEMRARQTFAPGYRVLVPAQFSQTAMRLVDATSSAYYAARP